MEQAVDNITYDNVDSSIELAPHVPTNVKDLPYSLVAYITRSLEEEHKAKVSKRQDAVIDERVELAMYVKEFNHVFKHVSSDFKADIEIEQHINKLHDKGELDYVSGNYGISPVANRKLQEYQSLFRTKGHLIDELRDEVSKDAGGAYVLVGIFGCDRTKKYYSEYSNSETKALITSPLYEHQSDARAWQPDLAINKPLTFKSKLEALQLLMKDDANSRNLAKAKLFDVEVPISLADMLSELREQGVEYDSDNMPSKERIIEVYEKVCKQS